MKPYKTFLFALISLLCIVFFACINPFEHIDFSKNIYLRLPKYKDIFIFPKTKISLQTELDRQKALIDSITQVLTTQYKLDTSMLFTNELRNIPSTFLEYDTLYPHPLKAFYKNLQNAPTSHELIRILHYGDSQIENERVTSSLRHYLQSAFGGEGKGIVSLYTNVFASGISIEKSNTWKKIEMKKGGRRGNFGLCNAYIYPLSQSNVSSNIVLNFSSSKYAEIKQPLFLQALVHEDISPNEIHFKLNNKNTNSQPSIESRYGLSLYSWALPNNCTQATLKFDMGKNHIVYALSVNDTSGIVVDNLPMRGSTGQIFFQNNRQFLTTNYDLTNVKLVIFQFGVNAIPQDPSIIISDYTYYENQISTELAYLRSLIPDLPILVVGTSDRSRKNGSDFETNPNVLSVRKAQRNAALKTGCAYWDLYTAMGGENSMQLWVNTNPPLANKDFIHFNQLGADKVGKMLYKSLIQDYQKYLFLEKKQEFEKLKINTHAKK
ncbi:MAG: hypothetical protein RRY15_01345 [Bacteroidales bacterium]